jgi:hypothetical protein
MTTEKTIAELEPGMSVLRSPLGRFTVEAITRRTRATTTFAWTKPHVATVCGRPPRGTQRYSNSTIVEVGA